MAWLRLALPDHRRAPGRGFVAGAVVVLLLGLLWAQAVRPGFVQATVASGQIVARLVKIIDVDDSGLPLGHPSKVAFDRLYEETYVYAANKRITIYDKNFFPLGSIGVGRGVANVSAMAVGPGGALYLCRRGGAGDGSQYSVVTIYNSALLVEREIILNDIPELAGDFYGNGLAVAADGTIYLVGYSLEGAARIYRGAAVLDNQGNFQGWLAPRGMVFRAAAPAGEEADAAPAGGAMVDGVADLAGVSIDESGRLYLLSTELSEIFVYDRQGVFLHTFGTKGGARGKLSTPRALGVDYRRRLVYVVDYMRHTILTYDYDDGTFLYEFGGKGVGPLWYQHPNDLAVDSQGRVLISDLFNRRVQVVDPANPERPVLAPVLPEAGVGAAPPAAAEPAAAATEPALARPEPLPGLAAPVAMASPPAISRLPARPVREIAAGSLKKKVRPAPPPLALTAIGPMVAPAALAEPPGGAVVPPVAAPAAPARAGGAGASGGFRALLGVYGPVAAMAGVGVWLLRR
jgi:outer membrane protein assembly factor BamB